MSKLISFINSILLLIFVSFNVHAITISEKIVPTADKGKFRIIRVNGPITTGDTNKFFKFIVVSNRTKVNDTIIALDSVGGSVNESYGIAGVIIKNRFSTVVAPTAQCLSACVNIFIVGNLRVTYPNSIIGVHRASNYYQGDNSSARYTSVEMMELFKRFNVPDSIRLKMIETPPEQMYILNKSELYELTNNKEGFNAPYKHVYGLIYDDAQ